VCESGTVVANITIAVEPWAIVGWLPKNSLLHKVEKVANPS